ncbi:SF1B family DNA helicase RecD2 [Facklamia miroungae]|uniref:ATP-dependent RecD2 DNA helicase n=1 Tax=Facklamia miroungae TaxID=120956 RepID=A0A1G7V6Y3_9LACT|nr:ATP-dependent RecD-like DNA helicase [Facklamia miroungae]NKZ30253.1 ATP-dependent RecD-like DNA helicase [Facklamia miroungae]SDG55261.1 exodeoxyribonuclease V alpha subunit [Facklamia miroungae]
MEELIIGSLESIIFENDQNFYKVLRIRVDLDQTNLLVEEELVITGQFTTIHYNTPYQFFGQLVNHPRFGQQFSVTRYQQLMPTSRKGLINYLSSNRFKGVGPKTAEKIVDNLGEKAIDQILDDPKALDKVSGLTGKVADQLRASLLKFQGTERIFMQLTEWGFGANLADKIYKRYQSHTLEKVKENPYQLVTEIEGIGFTKADQLAELIGIEPDAAERIASAITMAVAQVSTEQGDTYVSTPDSLRAARDLLEKSRRFLIEDDLLAKGLDLALTQEQLLMVGEDLIIPSIFYAEYGSSKKIHDYLMAEQVERFEEEEIDQAIKDVMALIKIDYDQEQQQALKLAIQSPLSIITGGPGTGKTTLVQGLIYLHAIIHGYDLADLNEDNFESPIRLAAPTGRAAKRMQDTSHLPASTIHRLIGYNRESTIKDFDPIMIDGSLLIVDEMSMVDVWLMNWLMQAIPYEMQVVLVGDKDQLPSVGPGKVFSDLIESGVIPTVSLSKIYRQSEDSSIVHLAHQIRQGYLPEDFLMKHSDRSFIPCSAQQVSDVVGQIVEAAVKKGFNSQTLQVLAPMYKGPGGINQINDLMQEMLNPASSKKREIKHFDQVYRLGDKVLQLVNNTEDGVYNGDIGKITAILTAKESSSNVEEVIVDFDGNEIHYRKNELDQLTLAYCCSIHKAQGSEYDLVILPLVDRYSRMLRRDIIYTAVTRAVKSLVMVGNPQSFNKAVSQVQIERKTKLVEYLQLNLTDQEKSQEQSKSKKYEDNKQSTNVLKKETTTQAPTKIKQAERFILNDQTIWQVDPMIGMEGLKPEDFMQNN